MVFESVSDLPETLAIINMQSWDHLFEHYDIQTYTILSCFTIKSIQSMYTKEDTLTK